LITLDAERTRALLPFDQLIEGLRGMFIAGCEAPLRHTHAIAVDGEPAGTLLLMPAWSAGGYLGVKSACIFPGNARRGLPSLHASYMLYDARTGVPLAQIDGTELTTRRTAAASALAAAFLARPDATVLALAGAGRVASVLAHAYRAIRPITRVQVWNVRKPAAEALAQRLRAEGFDAWASDALEAAVRGSDIVACATLATHPIVQGRWLEPGQHLDLIGAFTPDMREADADCFRAASVFVDTSEAAMKAGDLLDALGSGALAPEAICATLQDLCRGAHPGRRHAHEITLFKSVGAAPEDLAAAVLAYERAAGSARR
jgi:ornithine cyclodeaminase